MATSAEMPLWGGEIGEQMTSKLFLKRAEWCMGQMQRKPEEYIASMHLFFKDGSRAETWHEELEESEKEKGWAHYSKMLLAEFPTRKIVAKTAADYIRDLHDMSLPMEGLDVKNKETNQWPHEKFADNLWEVAKAARVSDTASEIYSVHKKLPKILQSMVSERATNWQTFVEELKAVEIKVIKEKLETAKDIKGLKAQQAVLQVPDSPRTRLANLLSNMRITQSTGQPCYGNQGAGGNRTPAADPFTSNAGGRGNLFQNAQRQQQQQQVAYQPQPQPLYQQPIRRAQLTDAQRETLKANVNRYEQKPNTPEGNVLWRQDLVAFTNQWSRAPPNENMVWPIAPGTQKPGMGECFICGGPSHGRGIQCTSATTIGEQERNYRRFVQGAVGAFQRPAARVYAVSMANDIDWMLEGYSGNGEGSTA
ncbi:hypothetical protein AAF712_010072 [Marasmius tenuissimus]|uniref:Gag protein n=1 Tax=Marasmius tenuissimus TaxID=585030 RepID=A0ABR2ZQP0_9AGAR